MQAVSHLGNGRQREKKRHQICFSTTLNQHHSPAHICRGVYPIITTNSPTLLLCLTVAAVIALRYHSHCWNSKKLEALATKSLVGARITYVSGRESSVNVTELHQTTIPLRSPYSGCMYLTFPSTLLNSCSFQPFGTSFTTAVPVSTR